MKKFKPNVYWPFEDPQNVAVFTLKRILHEGQPILYVSHDEDDGAWQFLDGEDLKEEDAALVSLVHITNLDSSIYELADLPLGWQAWRTSKSQPWQKAPKSN